jgi:3'-phosphoadenosine 5'-phosphosulfate sulfotransferase (PAPS reductase)/FAD synthetase
VWDLIKASGLPYHPIYDLGFQRLSCRLCPLAGDEDVALAALTYPQLAQKITAMEDTYGFKFKEKYGLQEIIERVRNKPVPKGGRDIFALAKAARQALRKHFG